MKVKTWVGKIEFELEVSTQTELFEELAKVQEVFNNVVCSDGKISSEEVRFVVRQDKDDNKYYELWCVDTDPSKSSLRYAKRVFGCHKKGGGLFPKFGGRWVKFDPQSKQTKDLVTGKVLDEKDNNDD